MLTVLEMEHRWKERELGRGVSNSKVKIDQIGTERLSQYNGKEVEEGNEEWDSRHLRSTCEKRRRKRRKLQAAWYIT
jgi:hypothetical protein